MSFERVHRSSSKAPQTSWSTSQFAPRPFPVQEPKRPPTQEELENQAFQQNKFEATGLQLKEKYGTITPVEQERLGMLQAKMDSFWAQRMERAKAQPNILEILIRNAQSAQTTEPTAPVQPKLTIGQPNDQYEQEADHVAKQVMSMAPPATPNIQQQSEEEQEEIQTKPLVETITPLVQRQEILEENKPIQAKCEKCEEEEHIQREITLPEINIVAVPPVSLRSSIGTMSYYRRRNADFMSRAEPGETPPDYYLNYGDKYVNRFKTVLRPKLSSAGQAWLDCTLIALQTAIEDRRDANPWAFAELERDNDSFRDFAYGTHSNAYVDCGVCELPISDQFKIVLTPDFRDLLTLGGVGQILDSFAMCNAVWFYPRGSVDSNVQRKGISGGEEEIQTQRSSYSNLQVGRHLENQLNASQGSPLPDDVKSFMEPRFRADFSQVRVHTGSEAVQMSEELNAQAFTHRQDIYFGAGKVPGKDALTAHELTHVIQQTGVIPADTSAKTQSSMPFLSENFQIARQPEEGGGASSTTSTPSSTVPSTVKVWIHSFIPMAQVSDPFGYCYSGDNRSFSNAIHASYRTHQEIEFDTSTGSPTINYKDTGTSHQLNCTTGTVEKTAKAPVSQLTNGSVNRSGSSYRMNFQADAKNPLAWYACNINLNLTLTVNPSARTCSIQGTHDGFPAYEVYVTANGGAGATVYTYGPSSTGAGPGSLCGGNEQTASGTVSF